MDNNTWNNSHIALVGKAMASKEEDAYKIMLDLDVDYILGAYYLQFLGFLSFVS